MEDREAFELEVTHTSESGIAESTFSLRAETAEAAVEEAKEFMVIIRRRQWNITKAQVVSIRKTGVLTIPLD